MATKSILGPNFYRLLASRLHFLQLLHHLRDIFRDEKGHVKLFATFYDVVCYHLISTSHLKEKGKYQHAHQAPSSN